MVEKTPNADGSGIWARCTSKGDAKYLQCRIRKEYPEKNIRTIVDIFAGGHDFHGSEITGAKWPYAYHKPEKWKALFLDIERFLSAFEQK